MSARFRKQTVQNGNVNSPSWLLENLGEFQAGWTDLDNENIADSVITEPMLKSAAVIKVQADPQTVSVILDNTSVFWQKATTSDPIHNVNMVLAYDALLTVTWSGSFIWDNTAVGDMGWDDTTVGGQDTFLWDAIAFRIVVDGTTVVDTGWIGDALRQNGTWIRGSIPVTAGTRNICVEYRMAQIQYGVTGDPIYGNATNSAYVAQRSLIMRARKR